MITQSFHLIIFCFSFSLFFFLFNLTPTCYILANKIYSKGTALFITDDRMPYLDYTLLNTPTTGTFVFRAPQLAAGKSSLFSFHPLISPFFILGKLIFFLTVSNIYTLPFRPMVWFSCLILVTLSTLLLHLTVSSNRVDNIRDINHHQKRITDSILSTIACVCQMDSSMRSTVTSSRIIMV